MAIVFPLSILLAKKETWLEYINSRVLATQTIVLIGNRSASHTFPPSLQCWVCRQQLRDVGGCGHNGRQQFGMGGGISSKLL